MESSQNSAMFLPPTVTASISFFSLLPRQAAQGMALMHASISSLEAWVVKLSM